MGQIVKRTSFCLYFMCTCRSSHRRCSLRKGVLKNFAISPRVCNFIKKYTLAHVLSCEFCEISISKNTFPTEHLGRLLLYMHQPIIYSLWIIFGRKVRIPTDTKRRARFLFQLKKKLSDMYKLANEAMTTRQTKAQIKT